MELDVLQFYYDTPHLSQNQKSGDLGVSNGCPHWVSRTTLQRWIKVYEAYGEVPSVVRKKQGKRRSGKRSLSENEQNMLRN